MWYNTIVGKRFLHSMLISLEWRLWAFIITTAFLWVTTGELGFAALQAIGLQIILFAGHAIWYYWRSEGTGAFSLDTLVSHLARYFYRSLVKKRD